MRRIAIVCLLLVACRGAGTSRPKAGHTGGEDGGTVPASTEHPEAKPPAERCADGEVWNGGPEGCAYEVDGCCYMDAEAACVAAKCAAASCEVLETHPAQVRCRTP